MINEMFELMISFEKERMKIFYNNNTVTPEGGDC